MNEPGKNPFEPFFDEIRRIVREEIGTLKTEVNGEDRLLDAQEAANRLSVSEDWLYRNAKKLPFTRNWDRNCCASPSSGSRNTSQHVKPLDRKERLLYIMYTMTGAELRRIREAMELTQRQLAERLGLTSTSVARMERGEQKIMQVTTLAVKYLRLMESKKRGKRK
jgi:DNA-binding transcriptional regulator YiaG